VPEIRRVAERVAPDDGVNVLVEKRKVVHATSTEVDRIEFVGLLPRGGNAQHSRRHVHPNHRTPCELTRRAEGEISGAAGDVEHACAIAYF
jgi:hypothetical protein